MLNGTAVWRADRAGPGPTHFGHCVGLSTSQRTTPEQAGALSRATMGNPGTFMHRHPRRQKGPTHSFSRPMTRRGAKPASPQARKSMWASPILRDEARSAASGITRRHTSDVRVRPRRRRVCGFCGTDSLHARNTTTACGRGVGVGRNRSHMGWHPGAPFPQSLGRAVRRRGGCRWQSAPRLLQGHAKGFHDGRQLCDGRERRALR